MLVTSKEKRRFSRIQVDCPVTFRSRGSDTTGQGMCRDLSGGGVLFLSRQQVPVGTSMEISVMPRNDLTPPLNALIEVVRSEPSGQPGGYMIAGAIREILDSTDN